MRIWWSSASAFCESSKTNTWSFVVWSFRIYCVNQSDGRKLKSMVYQNLCVGGWWTSLRKSLLPFSKGSPALYLWWTSFLLLPPFPSPTMQVRTAQMAAASTRQISGSRTWWQIMKQNFYEAGNLMVRTGVSWLDFREWRGDLCGISATSQCGCLLWPSLVLESLLSLFLSFEFKLDHVS